MIDLFKLLGGWLVGLFRLHADRDAKISFLRHLVLRRSAPPRLRLHTADRLISSDSIGYFRRCSERRPLLQARDAGPLASKRRPSLLALEVAMPCRPPGGPDRDPRSGAHISHGLWGAPRRRQPSTGWRAFLRVHTAHIAAANLFVIPIIGFQFLYRLVILRLERRRVVWINVTAQWGYPPRQSARGRLAARRC